MIAGRGGLPGALTRDRTSIARGLTTTVIARSLPVEDLGRPVGASTPITSLELTAISWESVPDMIVANLRSTAICYIYILKLYLNALIG